MRRFVIGCHENGGSHFLVAILKRLGLRVVHEWLFEATPNCIYETHGWPAGLDCCVSWMAPLWSHHFQGDVDYYFQDRERCSVLASWRRRGVWSKESLADPYRRYVIDRWSDLNPVNGVGDLPERIYDRWKTMAKEARLVYHVEDLDADLLLHILGQQGIRRDRAVTQGIIDDELDRIWRDKIGESTAAAGAEPR